MAGVVVVSPVLIADGYGNLISSDEDRLKVTAVVTEGNIAIGAPFPSDNPSNLASDFLRNSGGSPDMDVNGSSTPVIFSFDADATYNIRLHEIRTVFVSSSLEFGNDVFGDDDPLDNGVKYSIYYNSIETTLANLQTNEDFCFLTPGPQPLIEKSGAAEMITVVQQFGQPIVLRANSTDAFRVTIRDDLRAGVIYFRVLAYGIKE